MSLRFRPCAPRKTRVSWVLLIAALVAISTLRAEGPLYLGRPLIEVLNELRDGGLDLIFSSAFVGDDARVTVEPRAADPQGVLAEILEPLGLEIGDGPGESLLILPRKPKLGRVHGRLVTERDDLPVRRASVRLAGTAMYARSAADGSFDFPEVPEGKTEIVAEAFGFETGTAQVEVAAGRETRLMLHMRAKPAFTTAIVVTPERRFILQHDPAPQRSVDRDEALLVPAIGGDIFRVVELVPGVTASDNSAAFHVRGSTPEDVAIVLDGLELYDPFHLRSFQSPFGLVDGQIVERIDFLGGGFTADRGDRHGGFVDVSTIHPGDEGRGAFSLGSVNSQFSYGGPLGDSGTTGLFSVRGWYPEAWHNSILLGGGERLDPRFGDLYAKVSFAGSPRFRISAHSLLAFDRIEFGGQSADEPEGSENTNVTTKNVYFWLRAQRIGSTSSSSETVLSGGRIERRRDGTSAPGPGTSIRVRDERVFDFVGLKHDAIWQLSDSQALRAGVDLRALNTRYRYSNLVTGNPSASSSIGIDPAGGAVGAYLAYRARLSPRLAAETGLRWDRQSYTGEHQFSPRINATWLAGERSELLVSLGEFHQSQRIHELRVEDAETEFLPAELSKQAELTFKHRFKSGLRLRIDGFYKDLSRLRPRYENLFEPIELFPETRADRVLVAPALARLRGAELMLRGRDNNSLTWWVSYVRSRTDDIVDGRPVPRSWDQKHAVKFLIGHRWAERWTASLSGTAHSGWPTTAVRGEIPTGIGEPRGIDRVLGERNADRFEPYARLDGKLSGVFPLPRGRLTLTVEVANLTDRRNVCCVDDFVLTPRQDGALDVRRDLDHWLGITPSASISWEF